MKIKKVKKSKAKKLANALVKNADKKMQRRAWRNKVTFKIDKNLNVTCERDTTKGANDVATKYNAVNAKIIKALTKKYKNLYGEQHYKDFRAEASVPLARALQCDSAAKKQGIVRNTSYDACCNAMAKACELVQMTTAQKGEKS